jgi:radical SAM additional 4Fe4S-binding domain
MYILSKYNIFKQIDDTVIGVNLVEKILFALETEKYDKLLNYSNKLDTLKSEDPHFFSIMYKFGIITDAELDNSIFSNLLLNNRIRIFNMRSYRLTINPTLDCNFNCWYCYETHTNNKMTLETIHRVEKYIDFLIDDLKIVYFYLDWFGGEPLLCYENVMKPITTYAVKKCIDNNVKLESGITTNGYLLSEKMVSFFKETNFQSFQITLDGEKEKHDKTRFAKNGSGSYTKIVDNIIMLAMELNPRNLALRINFTQENFDGIKTIISSFPHDLRPRIEVHLQQVWQDKDENRISIEDTEKLKSEFEEAGFRVSKEILNLRGYTCYADIYNQAVINYDGRVFKCTAKNFEQEESEGFLSENGNIKWVESKLSALIAKATFENELCNKCAYLPICFGPCSKKVAIATDLEDFKKYCFEGGIRITLDFIMDQFKNSQKPYAPLLEYHI